MTPAEYRAAVVRRTKHCVADGAPRGDVAHTPRVAPVPASRPVARERDGRERTRRASRGPRTVRPGTSGIGGAISRALAPGARCPARFLPHTAAVRRGAGRADARLRGDALHVRLLFDLAGPHPRSSPDATSRHRATPRLTHGRLVAAAVLPRAGRQGRDPPRLAAPRAPRTRPTTCSQSPTADLSQPDGRAVRAAVTPRSSRRTAQTSRSLRHNSAVTQRLNRLLAGEDPLACLSAVACGGSNRVANLYRPPRVPLPSTAACCAPRRSRTRSARAGEVVTRRARRSRRSARRPPVYCATKACETAELSRARALRFTSKPVQRNAAPASARRASSRALALARRQRP
jgi:hypothetical protein